MRVNLHAAPLLLIFLGVFIFNLGLSGSVICYNTLNLVKRMLNVFYTYNEA